MADAILIYRGDVEAYRFSMFDRDGNPMNLANKLLILGVKPARPGSPLDDLTDATDPFKFAIELNGAGAVTYAKNLSLVGAPALGVIRLRLPPIETTVLFSTSYLTEWQIRYGAAGSEDIKSRPGPSFVVSPDLVRRTTSP
jgi:hypothetical protein